MRTEPFSFFHTRFDILLAVFLISLLIISLLVMPPLYEYYTYMLPMTDYEVEDIADFHNHAIGAGAAYGAMRNVTLLEDGSIDAVFAPSPYDARFQSIPRFEYSRNIKVGQTFVVGCADYEDRLEESRQMAEELKRMAEELKRMA